MYNKPIAIFIQEPWLSTNRVQQNIFDKINNYIPYTQPHSSTYSGLLAYFNQHRSYANITHRLVNNKFNNPHTDNKSMIMWFEVNYDQHRIIIGQVYIWSNKQSTPTSLQWLEQEIRDKHS